MKIFFNMFFFIAISGAISAIYACDCSPEVTNAYQTQIDKLKGYYAKLEKKVKDYTELMQKYDKKYKASVKRRKAIKALLENRKIELLHERKIIADILGIPVDDTGNKESIISNEIKLLKQ